MNLRSRGGSAKRGVFWLTHLPKLLYACLTEANLGVFLHPQCNFSVFYGRDENVGLLGCEPLLARVWQIRRYNSNPPWNKRA